MTHQIAIKRVIVAILAQENWVIQCFRRGNPFDKLLRSHDEFTANGLGLYRNNRGARHYRMSKNAYAAYILGLETNQLLGLEAKQLYGEHRIPLNIVIKRLVESDRTYQDVEAILAENEVVLITPEERNHLDSSPENGGLGLRSKLPPDGTDRLTFAGIEIAPETINNHL
jgi:hypothetical protein